MKLRLWNMLLILGIWSEISMADVSKRKIKAITQSFHQQFLNHLDALGIEPSQEKMEQFKGVRFYRHSGVLRKFSFIDPGGVEANIGFCLKKTTSEGQENFVFINTASFKNSADARRKLQPLVFHELLHCLLDQDHDESHKGLMASNFHLNDSKSPAESVRSLVRELRRIKRSQQNLLVKFIRR